MTYMAFDQDELERRIASVPKPYKEFLRRRHPHKSDEVYIVLKGRGKHRVADNELEVGPGKIVSVDHGEQHRFVNIAEDLHMPVVFAPPEG